jgi:hypothetical protein
MATRQEIQVGHDLIVFTDRVYGCSWHSSKVLQSLHPSTGETLMVQDQPPIDTNDELPEREPTVADIKSIVMNVTEISQNHVSKIESFLAKSPIKLIDNGLLAYGTNKTTIISDINKARTLHQNLGLNLASLDSKLKLRNFGKQCLYEVQLREDLGMTLLPVFEPPVTNPPPIRLTNIVHDLLDAISYELKGVSSYTGEVIPQEWEYFKELSLGRLKAVKVELAGANRVFAEEINPKFNVDKGALRQDLDLMTNIITHLTEFLPKCQGAFDLYDLGFYIDSQLPKLPLLRRHWAL